MLNNNMEATYMTNRVHRVMRLVIELPFSKLPLVKEHAGHFTFNKFRNIKKCRNFILRREHELGAGNIYSCLV